MNVETKIIYLRKASALTFSLVMLLAIFATVPSAQAASEMTYTLDADFDEGILNNVEYDTVHDQLQLSENLVSLPFIWVPNSNEGTVSKVDTDTGKELGRYRTGPTTWGNPSRTTVDLMGNVWVGNRNAGTVVKIGLYENGQCDDKNGNGTIETSQDLNNDGNITGAEILPWGSDECVLHEVTGIPGARGIAIDTDNNVWAGAFGGIGQYKHIDGDTGLILATIITDKPAYGALVDANGILWSSEWAAASVGKLDPAGPSYTSNSVPKTGHVYGMGIDANDNLFISGYTSNTVSKYDISSGLPVWKWTTTNSVLYTGRGVVVTNDGDIWVAATHRNQVVRLNNSDGAIKALIPTGSGSYPTGVSVDSNGKVWVVDVGNEFIHRIDPATNAIDLSKRILGTNHYGYSDMTGFVSRTITTKTGTWTVDFDSEVAGTPWGEVSWNAEEPTGTSVSVRVRSSNDQSSWSTWETATSGDSLTSTPDGQYLQVETTLQITSGDVSPILYDLTVNVDNQPPVADAGGPYVGDEGTPIVFDGSASSDPDGDVLTYEWDLDGVLSTIESTDATPSMTWNDDYSGIVTLTVTDPSGATDSATATVTVNNVNPTIESITIPTEPIAVGTETTVSASYTDPGSADTHTESWDWGDNAQSATDSHTYTEPGVYTVSLTVTDDDGGSDTEQAMYVVVYDPSAGFVTGGGWIDSPQGAYCIDETCSTYLYTGKANFGFVSKYKKGVTIPTGQTQFQFKAGDLNFHSDSYQWLVIAGAHAKYKGEGKINGEGNYGFMLTATDSDINGGGDVDAFRIKIWNIDDSDFVVYDNLRGLTDDDNSGIDLEGGSIVVHTKK